MARRNRRRNQDEERDDPSPSLTAPVVPRTDVRAFSDSRYFHPAPALRRGGVFHSDDRLVPHVRKTEANSAVRKIHRASTPFRSSQRPSGRVRSRRLGRVASPVWLRYASPKRVAVCVRRAIRKEVLFATKRAGSGGGRRKRRNNFNETSWIRC